VSKEAVGPPDPSTTCPCGSPTNLMQSPQSQFQHYFVQCVASQRVIGEVMVSPEAEAPAVVTQREMVAAALRTTPVPHPPEVGDGRPRWVLHVADDGTWDVTQKRGPGGRT